MSEVQSIVFDKSEWTKTQAVTWLKKHNFKTSVDETRESLRYRQHDPRSYKRFITKHEKHRTKTITLIIGFK